MFGLYTTHTDEGASPGVLPCITCTLQALHMGPVSFQRNSLVAQLVKNLPAMRETLV